MAKPLLPSSGVGITLNLSQPENQATAVAAGNLGWNRLRGEGLEAWGSLAASMWHHQSLLLHNLSQASTMDALDPFMPVAPT